MGEVFAQAGIEVRPEDRKRADRVIHEMTGTDHRDCPHAWSSVKERLARDREGFLTDLRHRWYAGDGKG
jgi:hypothetical protein